MASPAAELLERMASQLRSGEEWAHGDPAPTFDARPAAFARRGKRAGNASPSAIEPIARAVASGLTSAAAVAADALAAAEELQPALNPFTSIFHGAARADARRLDAAVADGAELGPLAGVPVAVKDLFDVRGVVTLAGSVALAAGAPAAEDATVVARLRRAGATLIGATNMDEFAYGFTTENSHYGPTRNPHDPARVAGGSSGGSAAAVAAGIVAAALGTDTNGSVRIPAAFCGVFGLRPTYGLVPRTGSVLFAPSLDAVGAFARTVRDLALVVDTIAGADCLDPTCTRSEGGSLAAAARSGVDGLVAARAAGELWEAAEPSVHAAAERVAEALGARATLELPEVGRARAAAIVITAAEGADQHQELLRRSPETVDARVRDRFVAGLDVRAGDYLAAQRFRRWWQAQVLQALAGVDVLVLPTVPCAAPLVDQATIELGGVTLPAGAVLGRFTQPLSLVGLPSLTVPVAGADGLPLGVQLAARPGGDGALVAAAAHLEELGVAEVVAPRMTVGARAR